MPRKIRNAKLDTPSARAKLPISWKPIFGGIGVEGAHLGYRRNKGGGKWVARFYRGDRQYLVETLADADDGPPADGVKVLTYFQAQELARQRVKERADAAKIAALGPVVSVRTAVEAYIDMRDARELNERGVGGLRRDARSRLRKHVLSNERLADTSLAALSSHDLRCWREGLKLRGASAWRTANDFRASLNMAARRFKTQLPGYIRNTIADELARSSFVNDAPVAREMQILSDADVRRLISAAWAVDATGDFGRLVLALAASGARFSQLARLRVGDVQANRLMIPVSRKGRGTKASSHIAVRVGDDVIAALRPATVGREGHEPLLTRLRGTERGPWPKMTRLWSLALREAGLPPRIIPYALRHSSIVRGLRAGLPTRLVAALHDTSSAMIEKHYSAFIIDAMDELSARSIVPLTASPATVVSLVDRAR